MLIVAAVILVVYIYQRRCYCATAITDGGDAVWYMNPTALLMNDVAVAGLTESVPMLLSATAKLYLCVRPSTLHVPDITL